MKNLKKLFSKITFILGIMAGAAALVIFISATVEQQKALECQTLNIRIDHYSGNFFLDENDVENIIKNKAGLELIGMSVNRVDFHKVEELLRENPFVDEAEIYSDIKGNVFVDIVQKEPVLRVINSKSVSYYIDKKGQKLPTNSKFTAHVPVSNGNIIDNGEVNGTLDNEVLKQLFKMAEYIHQDQFWSAQIEQIFVNDRNEFELIPRLGSHYIDFGDAKGLEGKFEKLMLFYKEGLKSVGWDQYRSINLKFKDQVVCTK